MHEIIYMKADYEPWWLFEGWENDIVSRKSFESKKQAQLYFNEMNQELRQKYPFYAAKGDAFAAYWKEGETEYCRDCEEELQIFHGLLWLIDGQPITNI